MHHLPSRYIPCDGRLTASAYFKSTLPAWGATETAAALATFRKISIHAPRMGSDSTVKAYSNDRIKRSTLREPHFLYSKNAYFSPIVSMCATTSRKKKIRESEFHSDHIPAWHLRVSP